MNLTYYYALLNQNFWWTQPQKKVKHRTRTMNEKEIEETNNQLEQLGINIKL